MIKKKIQIEKSLKSSDFQFFFFKPLRPFHLIFENTDLICFDIFHTPLLLRCGNVFVNTHPNCKLGLLAAWGDWDRMTRDALSKASTPGHFS